jgi:hypothetical protein
MLEKNKIVKTSTEIFKISVMLSLKQEQQKKNL